MTWHQILNDFVNIYTWLMTKMLDKMVVRLPYLYNRNFCTGKKDGIYNALELLQSCAKPPISCWQFNCYQINGNPHNSGDDWELKLVTLTILLFMSVISSFWHDVNFFPFNEDWFPEIYHWLKHIKHTRSWHWVLLCLFVPPFLLLTAQVHIKELQMPDCKVRMPC